jgi:CheY-like chemotaxis protein
MTDTTIACPYCGRALEWVPRRWFGRGSFACGRCGEFPDLAGMPAAERTAPDHPIDALAGVLPAHDGRPRVLLVDDSAEYRDLYALMLEHTATVITASRGDDAIAAASAQPLDAIVLDVMMPGMDGWQTCERLKASPLTNRIPVIMLTSLDGLDVPARAERAGAAAVLIKPCSPERLARTIAAAVQRRFGGSRRWTRKAVTTPLRACVNDLPASVVNLSYGGLCVRVDGPSPAAAASLNLTLPDADLSIWVDAVWTTRGGDELWVCGAEISQASDAWRGIVDAAN